MEPLTPHPNEDNDVLSPPRPNELDYESVLGSILHNLQTPLAVTRGYIYTLCRHWDRLTDADRKRFVDNAMDGTNRLSLALIQSEHAVRELMEVFRGGVDQQMGTLETEIARQPGVRDVRVRHLENGAAEVHVLMVPERAGDSIVDSIVEVFQKAGHNLPRERVKILSAPSTESVAQSRRRLVSLSTTRTDDLFSVRVGLELKGDTLVGEAEAAPGAGRQYLAVVESVLTALTKVLGTEMAPIAADLLKVGGIALAVVSVKLGDQTLVGSARVKRDQYDALARATLDALNRSVSAPRITA